MMADIDDGFGLYTFDLAEIAYPFPLVLGQPIQLDGKWTFVGETLAVSSEDDLRRHVLKWREEEHGYTQPVDRVPDDA
jgi:hypothetical protein